MTHPHQIRSMNLERLVKKFIRVESMAVVLYRSHLQRLPVALQPLICHIMRVEEKHRDDWKNMYQDFFHTPAPFFFVSEFAAYLLASILNFFGEWAILHGECFVEQIAIREYTRTLRSIHHPEIKRMIQTILQDEKQHQHLDALLREDLQDEEEHLHDMREALKTNK